MKKFSLLVVVALLAAPFNGSVMADDKEVIVPYGYKKTEVSEKDTVRISAKAPEGSKIQVIVSGAAKLDTTSVVIQKEGAAPVAGATVKEFEIKPTGKGKVTVTVTTVARQNGGPSVLKSTVETYEFEVK
jgi:hypothetical protein